MDMPDKIAVLTAKLAMANDDKARLQAENERLRAFVEAQEEIVVMLDRPPGMRGDGHDWAYEMAHCFSEFGQQARALLASLPAGGADDAPDHR